MRSGPKAGPAVTLAARDLVVSRGGSEILRGVDLDLHGGERVALTGPSGSGKTVLLSVLADLSAPDAGTVRLDDRPLASYGSALRQRVAVVLQGYALVALLTVVENVELRLLAAGLDASEARDRALGTLAPVGLAERADHLVEELSGGQQQRVAVATALVGRPDVLLADEPTAEQDPKHRSATLDALLSVADSGAAVLLATHDPAVAARCDRVLHLDGGRLRPSTP